MKTADAVVEEWDMTKRRKHSPAFKANVASGAVEEVYLKAYASVGEARRELCAYFRFYNGQRPHQAQVIGPRPRYATSRLTMGGRANAGGKVVAGTGAGFIGTVSRTLA